MYKSYGNNLICIHSRMVPWFPSSSNWQRWTWIILENPVKSWIMKPFQAGLTTSTWSAPVINPLLTINNVKIIILICIIAVWRSRCFRRCAVRHGPRFSSDSRRRGCRHLLFQQLQSSAGWDFRLRLHASFGPFLVYQDECGSDAVQNCFYNDGESK